MHFPAEALKPASEGDMDYLTIPPYGNEGGNTNKSYTPNLYGTTISSSVFKYLFVSSLNSQYAASISSGSAQMPLVQFLPSSLAKGL